MPFYSRLAQHDDRPALLAEDGRATSYRELRLAATAFAERLGNWRQLVFLEARNIESSIAAYVGCLIGGHPVYLFQDQDDRLLRALIERYAPNAVVHSDGESMRIERRHDEALDLHPDLRVLLSTSGSTGSPKFVKLSARNIDSNARSIAEYLRIDSSERAITSLKFNYSYGMSVVNSHLAMGASLLLTDRSVGDAMFWELFRRHGATSFAGVPYTFDTLVRMPQYLEGSPGLRYVTQAGGRLSPDLVRSFADLGRRNGWRFYVMYGQTEAAPRIAYLPPELAEAYPQAIGKAIPGGTIEILDEAGCPIAEAGRPGQLAYSGPNVMMGYAESTAALATDETPRHLATGDIAKWNEAGLVEIVGRVGRFVKPFGIRVNLDEVEADVRRTAPAAACTGTDEYIVIALRQADGASGGKIVADLSRTYGLPAFVFRVLDLPEIPRLPNGKIAYREIVDAAAATQRAKPPAEAVKPSRTEWVLARNQVITLLVSGLWHGAAWTFVSWGAFHGLMLVGQRQLWRRTQSRLAEWRAMKPLVIASQILAVFALVAVSRVLFRSESLHDAMVVFRKILTGPYDWSGIEGKSTLAVCIAIIVSVIAAEATVEYGLWRQHIARRRVLRAGIALTVLLVTLLLGDFTGGRFIYVRF